MEEKDEQTEFRPATDILPSTGKDDIPLEAMQLREGEPPLDMPFESKLWHNFDPAVVAKFQGSWEKFWNSPAGKEAASDKKRKLLAIRLKGGPAWAVSNQDREGVTEETLHVIQKHVERKATSGKADDDNNIEPHKDRGVPTNTARQFAVLTDDSFPVAVASMSQHGLNLALECKNWAVGAVNEHDPTDTLFIGTYRIPDWAYTRPMDVKNSKIKYMRYAYPWPFLRPGQHLSVMLWPADISGSHAALENPASISFYAGADNRRRNFAVALHDIGIGADTRKDVEAAIGQLKRAQVGYNKIIAAETSDEARQKLLDPFVVRRADETVPHTENGIRQPVGVTTKYLAERQFHDGAAPEHFPVISPSFAEAGILNTDLVIATLDKPYVGSNKRLVAVQLLVRAEDLNLAYQTDVFTRGMAW
jgi:hypothetical protein